MNILEAIGVLTLGYLVAGATLCVLAGSAAGEDELLAKLIYSFIRLLCWPLVLLEAFVPAVRRILLDPNRPDDEGL